MQINTKPKTRYTHEGAKASFINPLQKLRRSVMACMLWENNFYEGGISVADRILDTAERVGKRDLHKLAVEARSVFKLRHVPLLLLLALIKRGGAIVSQAIYDVINRPDEICELVALYWKDGKRPLSKQLKLGLALAFTKFDEYQFAKWNKPNAIKLRDVLFLVHAKPPKGKEDLYKRIANDELATPNTWESRMAAGQDKKEVFTDLLKRKKLGYMALLRNLRGMLEVGVSRALIEDAIANPSPAVLPFRFISAAKHAPSFEPHLDSAMVKLLDNKEKIQGTTIVLVDVSGSMDFNLSDKSQLTRMDAACGIAMLLSSICVDPHFLTFSSGLVQVPPRKGMALRDALVSSQSHAGTDLGGALQNLYNAKNLPLIDRIIIITDEQSRSTILPPKGKGYIINVATYENGIGYGSWLHINGFSEACIDYIQEHERTIEMEVNPKVRG